MKLLFVASIIICFIMTSLYFSRIIPYDTAMPVIVACLAVICLDKTLCGYRANNKRAFGLFGLAFILCTVFVISSLLNII